MASKLLVRQVNCGCRNGNAMEMHYSSAASERNAFDRLQSGTAVVLLLSQLNLYNIVQKKLSFNLIVHVAKW